MNNKPLSPEELGQRMLENFEKLTKELFAKGPIVWQDPRCPTKNHFVLEYEDGSLYLAIFDADKNKYKHVRRLKGPKR